MGRSTSSLKYMVASLSASCVAGYIALEFFQHCPALQARGPAENCVRLIVNPPNKSERFRVPVATGDYLQYLGSPEYMATLAEMFSAN